MTASRVAFCAIMLNALPAVAAATAQEFILDNGLKLIVQEDHRAPVAVVQVWYRVGASYEHDGITGVSHALEHMMFKGTEKHPPGEFSRIVALRGGRENAFTGTDYTAYFQTWAAENVGLSFELEADRMQHLSIPEKEFENEMRVILEERRLRTDDNPQALAGETVNAVAYQTSPYRHPVIGWAADIENMRLVDLLTWYRRWYEPNNATVVVVGDVDPLAVYELAKKNFGGLPAGEIRPPKNRPEVLQRGIKRISLTSDKARLPYLIMGFKAPVLSETEGGEQDVEEWEIYALDVLSETLDGDHSARLTRNLVRGKQIASSVNAEYSSGSRLHTLFSFNGVPRPGHTLADLEAAILEEIEAIKQQPPSAGELERIKTQVVADSIYERDSMFYQAMVIGSLETVGLDWRLKDVYVDKIRNVTAEQVQAVARKYLLPEHLTVAYLMPAKQQQ